MAISLDTVIQEIERRAKSHPIGGFQEVRKELKQKSAIPNGGRIFLRRAPSKHWTFHYGARTGHELQFNIGLRHGELRHGVAFSLQASRTVPNPMVLVPKVERFNDFLRSYPKEYSDFWMWHWPDGGSAKSRPAPIESALVRTGVFIFLGRQQPVREVDYEMLLNDLDRMLPLYEFVEGSDFRPRPKRISKAIDFKPGCTVKARSATASLAERKLDIELRHNEIQEALHNYLTRKYGARNVGTERPCPPQKIRTR
jgi:hypothetical protein